MRAEFSRSTPIARSARVTQVEGMFGMEPAERVERRWSVDLPVDERDWHVGLVVGPSGSGKTTVLEECFGYDADLAETTSPIWYRGDTMVHPSVLDCFPDSISTEAIVRLLSAVGFSSPPAWLRPLSTLSAGELFRVSLAHALSLAGDRLAVIDEFTSTVDRTVAKTASVAVARHARTHDLRLVVASCHFDIIDWLQPDWTFDTGTGAFSWRSLHRRPPISLELRPATRDEWAPFAVHHYLNGDLASGVRCVIGLVDGRPATFVATRPTPTPGGYSVQREHRLVCLPDFQGVGLGHATADLVAACWRQRGWRYRSTTSHPAVIARRARSRLWSMTRRPGFEHRAPGGGVTLGSSSGRRTATFEYVGPAAREDLGSVLDLPLFRRQGGEGATTRKKTPGGAR